MSDTLASYLSALLHRRGWSGRTLAMYAELGTNTVAKALRGDTIPDPDTIRKIAEALQVDELHLLRLAGHVEAMPESALDPAAAYLARRITELPLPLREMAIDAAGAAVDAIYAAAGLGAKASAMPQVGITEEERIALLTSSVLAREEMERRIAARIGTPAEDAEEVETDEQSA